MRIVMAVILLAFLTAVGIFAVQNMQVVPVQFVNWKGDYPLAFMSVVIYFLGMLSGWSVVGFLRRSISEVSAADRT